MALKRRKPPKKKKKKVDVQTVPITLTNSNSISYKHEDILFCKLIINGRYTLKYVVYCPYRGDTNIRGKLDVYRGNIENVELDIIKVTGKCITKK